MEPLNMPVWQVYRFPWGSAIKRYNGDWSKVYLSPSGQEVDVENLYVELHENGIEILGEKSKPHRKGVVFQFTGGRGS